MVTSNVGNPRGILNRKVGERKFHLSLHLPAPDLDFFVEHYWIVNWDLRGQEPYVAETLPHPCVHLVIQKDQSRIVGVATGKFSYLLEGKGRVFGVKFKPGAFYPFVKSPIAQLTDGSISFRAAFDVDSAALEGAVLSREDEGEMVALAEQFIRERLPERDENVAAINRIVDRIIADRAITKVDDVVSRLNLNKRALQRIFSQYVGVSPKWVIKRYRLHEAAELLADGEAVDWPQLALDLGYFDQAHFIKDFKGIVGRAPADYAKNSG
ncbi:MAG: helix-turn-helix domain-containing protein [Chloroflexota bacterium]|nr:helix-turn-helix domain-containing protein [Chloroflexota bacterium]